MKCDTCKYKNVEEFQEPCNVCSEICDSRYEPEEPMPEIIRCKDCKNGDWYTTEAGKRFCYCMEYGSYGLTETDFCSRAEREKA